MNILKFNRFTFLKLKNLMEPKISEDEKIMKVIIFSPYYYYLMGCNFILSIELDQVFPFQCRSILFCDNKCHIYNMSCRNRKVPINNL